ncbi:MAG: bifunctional [glutamine synthetase] adenylyltransferase/[glutamine synthetase]-adenylyl-L-tyrosine phosphorylase [Parvularcula sp.]
MEPSLTTILERALRTTGEPASARFAGSFTSTDEFLSAIGRAFPFVERLMKSDPARLRAILDTAPEKTIGTLLRPIEPTLSAMDLKRELRSRRQALLLCLAICDLGGVWPLEHVVSCLSDFADFSLEAALVGAWRQFEDRFGAEGVTPRNSGLALIGMGKLGGRELNYSSDIDFVAIFDPEKVPIPEAGTQTPQSVCVRVVQSVVEILNQQTSDGFVFRTDLRLRPNPGATPVAVSLGAAEHYYQVYGQNWERAAYIKARHCAGDSTVGAHFIDSLQPFIWRRSLDYGAVADIHAVKNQIHAERGRPDLGVRGGNIKLGPGGIREIEFFVQMQQLLLGGRDPTLRTTQTLAGLKRLSAAGHISKDVCERMSDAYCTFRHLEHRLQLREDAQTHEMPVDDASVAKIALAMGFSEADDFEKVIEKKLRCVHDTYADLFAKPAADSDVGSLVFTGVDDDPRTLRTLRRLGFVEPEAVTKSVRRWHRGDIRATRTVRSRELLTGLIPALLKQMSELGDPDRAFKGFDGFLAVLPGGFQLFALLTAEPAILNDIVQMCGAAPGLASRLGTQPALIEGLLSTIGADPVEIPTLPAEATLEDHLDEVRRVVNEHRTRISVGLVLGRIKPEDAGPALADMAEAAIERLVDQVVKNGMNEDFRKTRAELAIVAFGRLGARRLTTQSDLDLVFVYSPDEENGMGAEYFSRLTRRIVSALSVRTSEGELYSIDMKLRPSGGAGPAAVSFSSFQSYYARSAWVWEEMALTKARVLCCGEAFINSVDGVITQSLERQRDEEAVRQAVCEMRARLQKEKPPKSKYDLKRRAGGLTDIEFMVQFLVLIHASQIGRFPQSVDESLLRLGENSLLDEGTVQFLRQAYGICESLIQFVRAVAGSTPPQTLTPSQTRIASLSFGATAPEFDLLDAIDEQCTAVMAIQEQIFGQKIS